MNYRSPAIVQMKLLVIVLFFTLAQFVQADYLPKNGEHYVLPIPADYFSNAIPVDSASLMVDIINDPGGSIQNPFIKILLAQLQLKKRQEQEELLKIVDDLLEHVSPKEALADGEKEIARLTVKQSTDELSKETASEKEVLKQKSNQGQEKTASASDEEVFESGIDVLPVEKMTDQLLVDIPLKLGLRPHSLQTQLTVSSVTWSRVPWIETQCSPLTQNIRYRTAGTKQQLYFQESKIRVSSASKVSFVSSKTPYSEQISWPWIIELLIISYDFIVSHKIVSLLGLLVLGLLLKMRH